MYWILITLTGFLAAMVDGGLGMGFGPISSSLLLSLGVGTAAMSTIVNLAQAVTAGASAIANFKLQNYNLKIVRHLVIAGIPGGAIGSYIATRYQNISGMKIIIAVILLGMGLLIIYKTVLRKTTPVTNDIANPQSPYSLPRLRHIWSTGLLGGFFSALAGSWGPIVTGPLLMYNSSPRKTIGSVNIAEFAVRSFNVIALLFFLKSVNVTLAIPLMIGGVIAAPIAVMTIKKIPHRAVGLGAGILIVGLSLLTISKALF